MTNAPKNMNLLEGSLPKQIFIFSLPLIFSNLLQLVFNLADIAVAGQFVGPMALGAVGSTSILLFIFTGFLMGLGGGINVVTARYHGAADRTGVSNAIHTAAVLSVLFGLFLLAVGLAFGTAILKVLDTKPTLLHDAALYLRIYFFGMPALAVYNFGSAVFSALGNPKKPVVYLTISGIVNIVLNLTFVIVVKLGVAGVALASVISQYLSAFLVCLALSRDDTVCALQLSKLRLHKGPTSEILRLGVPGGLQNCIFGIASLFVQAGVNTFDEVMVSGSAAASNADNVIYDVMAAFYTACGSFMGQNYGAKNAVRVKNSYLVSLMYSFCIGTGLGLLLILFGRPFLRIFTSDAAVIEAGMLRLTIMGLSYGLSAPMDCSIAASRALGKGMVPTLIVIGGSCVFRIIWVRTIFAFFGTIPSLYLLYAASWTLTALAEIIYFIYVYKKTVRF